MSPVWIAVLSGAIPTAILTLIGSIAATRATRRTSLEDRQAKNDEARWDRLESDVVSLAQQVKELRAKVDEQRVKIETLQRDLYNTEWLVELMTPLVSWIHAGATPPPPAIPRPVLTHLNGRPATGPVSKQDT